MAEKKLYDHIAASLSDLDLRMIKHVPPGGNWTDIPESVPSQRLEQIRQSARDRGGVVRTTYYGRLEPDKPSYTISTYFNRPGNGCNVHPSQERTLTIREAARLQSFPDRVKLVGSQAARRRQVGNAVPPLLARAVGNLFPSGTVVDLFAGAGAMSYGLSLAGHKVTVASDSESETLEVHRRFHDDVEYVVGDIDEAAVRNEIAEKVDDPALVVGGPPCQGWSYAGWHDRSDPRNELVWSFIDMLDRLGPDGFVMENVQGLIWMADGEAIEAIKDAMRKVGYSVNHFVLNAADYGVPQRRKRVFIVGKATGKAPERPQPLFTDSTNDMFLPYHITVEEAIGDLPPVEEGGGKEVMVWDPPADGVAYREWCRGQIGFEEMYRRTKSGPGREETVRAS